MPMDPRLEPMSCGVWAARGYAVGIVSSRRINSPHGRGATRARRGLDGREGNDLP